MSKRIYSLLVLILLVASSMNVVSSSLAGLDSWTSKAPMHMARSRLGVGTVNGKIYAIGGDAVNLIGNCIGPSFGSPLNTTEEYNPITGTWVFKKTMPTPRCSFAVAVYQNKIYCIGGYLSDRTVTGANEVYDPATDTWESREPMPTRRMDLQASVVDGKIYLIGGRFDFGSYLSVNEVYDPETDSWETRAPSPSRIISGASATAGGKVYVLATVSRLDLGALIQSYNPETDSWSIDGASPTYGDWSTTADVTSGPSPKIVFFSESSTCVYNPASGVWTGDAAMPTARGFTGVAFLNGMFYVIGGIKAPFAGYIVITSSTNSNEQYSLGSDQGLDFDDKIHIKADGSVEPSTANITTSDKIHYVFTGNNYRRIIIERDNIILDGKGYVLQGTESNGIAVFNRTNVVITNVSIEGFPSAGISLERSTNIIIAANVIAKSLNNGIRTFASSNCTIVGNRIQNNKYMSGIQFEDESNNNRVYGNDIRDNYMGVFLLDSEASLVYDNNFQNTVNAKVSDGLKSFWDDSDSLDGNYWSDYLGSDSDGDGIGDTPLILDSNNRDRYPLMTPFDISSVTIEMPDFSSSQNSQSASDGEEQIVESLEMPDGAQFILVAFVSVMFVAIAICGLAPYAKRRRRSCLTEKTE